MNPTFKINPQKLDWLAQNFDPEPFAAELERVAAMGSNMITQPALPGTTPAAEPGTANFGFADMVGGPGAPAATPGNAPLPAGMLQGMMQKPAAQMKAPPGTMPKKTQFPQLPMPGAPKPAPSLHQILYGGKG